MSELSPHVLAATRLHTDALLERANVVAVGAGIKRTRGAATGEPAVLVYVTRKLPREMLRPHDLVPGRLAAEDAEVPTDVIQTGEPAFIAVDDATYRPLRGGCMIGTAFGGSGTAGAVMYDRRDQQVVLLTNNHVLTMSGSPTTLPASTAIFQPAGGSRIGQSKRIVPMFRAPLGATDHSWFANVDAGIVSIDGNIAAQFDVVEIGDHPYVVLPPSEGLEVVRRGYRTQLREGSVEAVGMTVIVRDSNRVRYKIGGAGAVFSIRSREREIAGMPGDSGSLVVDAAGGAARGLVFASDEQTGGVTWACELGTVMGELELDTPCTGALNAIIRRAVYRRLADRWALAQAVSATAGVPNALVAEQVDVVSRFRRRYLGAEVQGTAADSAGAAAGLALQRLGPALALAISHDEDAAGLLERAFGDWLVQPTVFDMLEYRFDEQAQAAMSHAFAHLQRLGARDAELETLAGVFLRANGRPVRELLSAAAHDERRGKEMA